MGRFPYNENARVHRPASLVEISPGQLPVLADAYRRTWVPNGEIDLGPRNVCKIIYELDIVVFIFFLLYLFRNALDF